MSTRHDSPQGWRRVLLILAWLALVTGLAYLYRRLLGWIE